MRQSPGDFDDLRRALEGGSVQNAYRALLGYMNDLRRHFGRKYPKYTISALYQGYLDMTYFAVMPPSLKRRGLKIAVVFNYEHSQPAMSRSTASCGRSSTRANGPATGLFRPEQELTR
jgi:hypothetical protein